MLEWQWEQKAIPYWTDAGRFASTHGVKVALEPHPGFLVYNVETALRLRAVTDPAVGVNFDPNEFRQLAGRRHSVSDRCARVRLFTSMPRM